MTYGERFRQLRHKLWKGRLLDLAQRLGTGYPSSVTNIERSWRVPNLTTLAKHADALGCQPWELLDNVDTEYDLVRQVGRLPQNQAQAKWKDLLRRYEESTTRKAGGNRGRQPRVVAPVHRARPTG